jgi:OmpA-OmpF porin, OOP family
MRNALVLGVLGLAGTLASPALADEFSGFRLGLNLGSDTMKSDYFEGQPSDPLTPVDSLSSDRFGYGVFGGWALNKWVAVEAGFVSGSHFNSAIFPDPTDDFFDDSSVQVKGAEATVVGTFWLGNKFAIFGRGGLFAWNADVTETFGFIDDPTSRTVWKTDDDGFDPVFGLGVQTVLDGALLRLEYKQAEIGDLRFVVDDNGTATPADDDEVNWLDNKVSSLTFSIVWTLH